MFLRSIERIYTAYVGDGDSSAFGTVRDGVLVKFDEDYSIVKEDIQKTYGSWIKEL